MKCYLGLGSNLGERLTSLKRAVALLGEIGGLEVLRSSRVYETEPVGGPEQPEYLNAVIEIETTLDPHALLKECIGVEEAMGRVRADRWGPRNIDIDVLTYGREEVDDADLTVPHPRMHERMFVLAPLLELDADPPLPGGRRVASMRLDRVEVSGVTPFSSPLA